MDAAWEEGRVGERVTPYEGRGTDSGMDEAKREEKGLSDFTRALPHAKRICMVMICGAAGRMEFRRWRC